MSSPDTDKDMRPKDMQPKAKNKQSQLDKVNLDIAAAEQEFTQLSVTSLVQKKNDEKFREMEVAKQQAQESQESLAISEVADVLESEFNSATALSEEQVEALTKETRARKETLLMLLDKLQTRKRAILTTFFEDEAPVIVDTAPSLVPVVSARQLPNKYRLVLFPKDTASLDDLEDKKNVELFKRQANAAGDNHKDLAEQVASPRIWKELIGEMIKNQQNEKRVSRIIEEFRLRAPLIAIGIAIRRGYLESCKQFRYQNGSMIRTRAIDVDYGVIGVRNAKAHGPNLEADIAVFKCARLTPGQLRSLESVYLPRPSHHPGVNFVRNFGISNWINSNILNSETWMKVLAMHGRMFPYDSGSFYMYEREDRFNVLVGELCEILQSYCQKTEMDSCDLLEAGKLFEQDVGVPPRIREMEAIVKSGVHCRDR